MKDKELGTTPVASGVRVNMLERILLGPPNQWLVALSLVPVITKP